MTLSVLRRLVIAHPEGSAEAGRILAGVLQRQTTTRSNIQIELGSKIEAHIVFESDDSTDGYRIGPRSHGALTVSAAGLSGWIAAVGKILKRSTFGPGWMKLAKIDVDVKPECEFRTVYFATHFGNWYEAAPLDDVTAYIEELALEGFNSLAVWFDLHEFDSIHDPNAERQIARLRHLMTHAASLGLNVGMGGIANEAYRSSPQELRASYLPGDGGYFAELYGHYHVELCPSRPGAQELLLRWAGERFQAFADVPLDYFFIWPYDQGGCTCTDCAPWGANGFLRIAEPLARKFKEFRPDGQVIISTWYFDRFVDDEWKAFARMFAHPPEWADMILADDYGDRYPPYPLENGSPGGLPLVSFPEVSMCGTYPWGGFGANPMPQRISEVWRQACNLLHGSMLYSEGRFEDLNKAVIAGLLWDTSCGVDSILEEYARYHLGVSDPSVVVRAIKLLESASAIWGADDSGKSRFQLTHAGASLEAFHLLDQLNTHLPDWARRSWRWRILYLRALIGAEFAHSDVPTERADDAFLELESLYHSTNAHYYLRPPSPPCRRGGAPPVEARMYPQFFAEPTTS